MCMGSKKECWRIKNFTGSEKSIQRFGKKLVHGFKTIFCQIEWTWCSLLKANIASLFLVWDHSFLCEQPVPDALDDAFFLSRGGYYVQPLCQVMFKVITSGK